MEACDYPQKNGKFTNLASKTITSIAVKEIRKIADSIFSSRKYSALWDFFELVYHIWYFARVRDYLNKDIFGGIKLIDGYILPKSGGYGHIKGVTDLKILLITYKIIQIPKASEMPYFLAYCLTCAPSKRKKARSLVYECDNNLTEYEIKLQSRG